jgi:hypothetical protein
MVIALEYLSDTTQKPPRQVVAVGSSAGIYGKTGYPLKIFRKHGQHSQIPADLLVK